MVTAILLGVTLSVLAAPALGQSDSDAAVEVYLHESRTIPSPGVTRVTVLDEVAAASVGSDQFKLFGLMRGETIAFVWTGGQRQTIVVHVVDRPAVPDKTTLLREHSASEGQGFIASSVRTTDSTVTSQPAIFLHQLEWQQPLGPDRLLVRAQAQDITATGQPAWNMNSGTIQYATPYSTFTALDFLLRTNPAADSITGGYSQFSNFVLRGGDVDLKRGRNEYEFYAGTTQPAYYLSLSGTRAIAGVNFAHRYSGGLAIYATTALVNAPFLIANGTIQRESSGFQTLGAAYHISDSLTAQATTGISTKGSLLQGALSYSGHLFHGFVTSTRSSASFPLNQLQLLYAGGSSITAGGTYRLGLNAVASGYFQHSTNSPTAQYPQSTRSDYINPNLAFRISQRHQLTLNYAWNRARVGVTSPPSTTQRADVLLNSNFHQGFSNTIQVSTGSISDAAQLRSEYNYNLQDTLTIAVHGGTVSTGVQYVRSDPALTSLLESQINLLSPELQQLFRLDPTAFVQSSNLSPQLRSLLDQIHPSDTEIFAGGQFRIGRKLNLAPNVRFVKSSPQPDQSSRTALLGYAATYQLVPGLQLQSSLSNVWLFSPTGNGLIRTTVFLFGFRKDLNGMPTWMPLLSRPAFIDGRVCLDANINGRCDSGEQGLSGIEVELVGGPTVRTDAHGAFSFRVREGQYRVRLPIKQFKGKVRATNASDVPVDLSENGRARLEFAIINFSRVLGNVYNNYVSSDRRPPDAPGLQQIRVTLLAAGQVRASTTDAAGDFEIDDVPSGDYELSVDRASLPANYVAGAAIPVHVDPVATVVQDVPIQALRSIAGTLLLKSDDPSAVVADLQPIRNAKLVAGGISTETDDKGAFVLRSLPAGELDLQIVPREPLPEGAENRPIRIRMPKEPVQADGVKFFVLVHEAAMASAAALDDVRFDFGSCKIRPDQLEAIRRNASFLRSHPDARVVLEGHCDDRGPREYNRQLGSRRAHAVSDALVGGGAQKNQIVVKSYGKDRPACTATTAECRQTNRRVNFRQQPAPATAAQAGREHSGKSSKPISTQSSEQ